MAVTVGWITESVRVILQISGLTSQTFLVFCAAFFLGCFLLKRRRNLPPYPAGRVPVLGHLLALGRAPHLKLTAWRRQYGDVFTVRMGMEDVVVLNGYTAVKDALVDRSELFATRPPLYLLDTMADFGKDIVGARWGTGFKQRKRFATAVMKNLGMKGGTGSIMENIREEANCLRNMIAEYNGRPFDIAHDVTVAVANVICTVVMGKRYDYRDETFRELSGAVVTVMDEVQAGQIINVFPLLRFVPGVNRAGINALKDQFKVEHVMRQEISRHRENLNRENPRDLLDFCLLEIEKQEKVEGLTEQNVLYMAQNLFFAGIITTTNTLLWSLLYMTLNPDVQNKVQQELDAVVGESLPALSHRSQLPYVNACLLEVMRIRPIAPLSIPHATTEMVKVREYVIPKGTQVLLNLNSLHMDPAYWPDPDRFDPGRFLDAEGRRVCLGEQLARMELFLFFSTLLQSFTFQSPEDAPRPTTEGVNHATLRPHPFKLSSASALYTSGRAAGSPEQHSAEALACICVLGPRTHFAQSMLGSRVDCPGDESLQLHPGQDQTLPSCRPNPAIVQTKACHRADQSLPSCRPKPAIVQTKACHRADQSLPSCRPKPAIVQTKACHRADQTLPSCRPNPAIVQTKPCHRADQTLPSCRPNPAIVQTKPCHRADQSLPPCRLCSYTHYK
ncbi:cytochrome P450 2 sub U member 1 [Branchiostoma belcheri]|nr:cytochrome P450 2 sub U member 1 [Branchiostoma belcheri]